MVEVEKRFFFVDVDGNERYPVRTKTDGGDFLFECIARGAKSTRPAPIYCDRVEDLVDQVVFKGRKVRATHIGKNGKLQKNGVRLGARVIQGYEIADELQHLVSGAPIPPLKTKKNTQGASKKENGNRQSTDPKVDEKVLVQIKSRRGQSKFRSELLNHYSGSCCVTGCKVISVLEAVHIKPHSKDTDYSLSNGLLLRSDLHTLYDLNLIGINGSGVVEIADPLKGSEYAIYENRKINGEVCEKKQILLEKRYNGQFRADNKAV